MQFNTSNRRTPYFSQREQRKMLAMAMTLVFVIVAIQWAAQPENWHWIAPPVQNEPDAGNQHAGKKATGDIAEKEKLPHGVFIARVDSNGQSEANTAETDDAEPVETETESPESAKPDATTTETDPGEEEISDIAQTATVDRAKLDSLLEGVSDSALGIRPTEVDAFYAAMKYTLQIDPSELENARTDVSFTNLQAEPEAFRAELIKFEGEALRIAPLDVSENDYGFTKLYEAWIQTRDSGTDLYRVVFLETGDDISIGDRVSIPVTVTGLFFKRQGYQSVNGQNVAPLVLAKTLTKTKYSPTDVPDESMDPYVIGFAVIVGLAAVISVWFYSQGDRKFEQEERAKYTAASDEAIDALKQMSEND